MGIETEIKFAIPNGQQAKVITSDPTLLNLAGLKDWNRMLVSAVYYDTPDFDLLKTGIVYRVRKEGQRLTATVKKGGATDSFLQQRQEWNVEVQSLVPDAVPFINTGIGPELKQAVGESNMVVLFSCAFERRYGLLLLEEGTHAELAVDIGEICAGGTTEPICELELELKQGDLPVMLALGLQIAEQYGLRPETRSKFSRGLAILGIKEPASQGD